MPKGYGIFIGFAQIVLSLVILLRVHMLSMLPILELDQGT